MSTQINEPAQTDADYDALWESIEKAADQVVEDSAEDDIFAAFEAPATPVDSTPIPPISRVTAGADPDHPGEFAVFIDGDTMEQFFPTLESAAEAIPDWEQVVRERDENNEALGAGGIHKRIVAGERAKKEAAAKTAKVCAICDQVSVNKNSPVLEDGRKVCKKCQLEKKNQLLSDEEIAERAEGLRDLGIDRDHEYYKENPDVTIFRWQNVQEYAKRCNKDAHDILVSLGYGKTGTIKHEEIDEVVAVLRKSAQHQHFIVYANAMPFLDLIWGLGTGPFEALEDAEKNWKEHHEVSSQDILVCSPCTPTLYELVQKFGGDPKMWQGNYNAWYLKNDVAIVSWVDRSSGEPLPKSEDSESVPATAADGSPPLATDAPASVTSSDEQPEPVRTDAGLIDPETGEILEASLIYRKFGWTAMPELPENPTPEEVNAYEAKCDQVLDLLLSYQEKTARWRAAAELRCKPLDSVCTFYDEQFLKPMGRRLAKYRLPVFKSGKKKGQFSGKTLALRSGAIRFTASGGAYVHDSSLVKAHIQAQGVDNFKTIGAEQVIIYNYQKLLSALNKGVLKDIPGTGTKPKDELASVKAVSPNSGTDNSKEDMEDEE